MLAIARSSPVRGAGEIDETGFHPQSVLRRGVEAKIQELVAGVAPRVMRHGRRDIVLVQLGDEGLHF